MRSLSASYFTRLGCLVVAGFVLLVLQQGGLDSAIRSGIFWTLRPGMLAARTVSDSVQLVKEALVFVHQGGSRLAATENELAKKRVQMERVQELERQNQLLRQELGKLPSSQKLFRFYGGNGHWFVDGGCNDGIKAGAPVYADGSLVGQIERVQTDFSEVRALVDQDFRLAVKVGTSSAVGLLQNARGVSEILSLPLRAGIREGDNVLSQGVEAIPPNIPIGRVRLVTSQPDTGTVTAQFEPFFSPARLEFIAVSVGEGVSCW